MTAAAPTRVAALDGLRGWASLSVVVFHLGWETFGKIYPDFRSFPEALIANGSLAVSLFLMVSGYVLTIRGWRDDDKDPVRRSLLKRYFRLTPPILVSVLIYWAVVALGWSHAHEAGLIVHRPDWLAAFARFGPNLGDVVGFGLFGAYVQANQGGYGPFLWTMAIEFWGSFVVLALCWFELPGRWSYAPLVALTAIGLMLPWSPYFPIAACYPAGALVALMSKDGLVGSDTPGPLESATATVVAILALIGAALAEMSGKSTQLTALVAMAVFLLVLRSGPISRFLSLPLSQWLGRLSFPLYLIQISVIVTITSGLIVVAKTNGLLAPAMALAIALLSLAACLLGAWLMLPVERFALDFAGRIGRLAIPPVGRPPSANRASSSGPTYPAASR
jgi:peptidoglycan/LPS O-acetylase OafA/YrhL